MFTVTENKILFDKGLIIEEGKIKSSVHQKTFTRQRIKRDDASAVLMLNTDTNNIILTRQFRYATESKISGQLFEIVAGKVDYNEQPLETAIREAKEETGYNISPNNIQLLLSCFSSPGYSSERFFIYFATVKNSDKAGSGGGNAEENEFIEVIDMSIDEFRMHIKNRTINDSKTYLSGLYMDLYLKF